MPLNQNLKDNCVFFKLTRLAVLAGAVLLLAAPAFAADSDPVEDSSTAPPYRDSLEAATPKAEFAKKDGDKDKPNDVAKMFDTNIRIKAQKEAALSYGARGGLAWRTFQIRNMLEEHGSYLDKVYDFNHLLIPAPSGLLIEPPIVTEEEKALIIATGGQEAAVADRHYSINKQAKIVSTPRMWRNYLERDWGEVLPPPDILLPETKEERDAWIKWVRVGWDNGIEQADAIYQDDLNQLTANYQGMVRYRMLLSQGMISPPYALQVDRGVTGGGDEMRVGDRAVQITGKPELQPGSDQWQPANR
ncbi:MAG: hypothetical protein JWO78_1443 [Micavibrio sp.]|nr:hypothetical protein [Micavibrio sp.]